VLVDRNCLSADELLAFHLGTLSDGALDEAAAHLETCPRCEAEVQRLDAAVDKVLAALRKPISHVSALNREAPRADEPDLAAPEHWPHVPGYEILAPLGRGGMGVVYKARQLRLNRPVALKRLREGGEKELRRSRVEAESLARLQHPNIVQIYEFVEHAGQAFLALELVEGGSLSDRLTGKPLPPRETAAFLQAVAGAVHYAHANGIVHRDLKPANVLLTGERESGVGSRESGKDNNSASRFPTPDSRLPIPKLTDFGIAKRLAADGGETRDGDVIGTPSYMAPEQAAGKTAEVGPATDVYSMGVILYEMLTGRVPLLGPTTLDTLILVRTEEPVPPRRLQPRIPGDLETICLKCLEKEPGRRFASAADLAADLSRFLRGEPIRARPTPAWERAWKWAERRPAVAALSTALVLLAAVAFGLVAWQWHRAEDKAAAEGVARRLAVAKEREEKEARRQVERLTAGMALRQGVALCEAGEVGRGLLWLTRSLELAERTGDAGLERAARCNLASWPSLLVRPRAELAHTGWICAVALSPDGRVALTGGIDHTVRLWDTATGRLRGEPLLHADAVCAAAFSPDGKQILTGSGDDRKRTGSARLWDAATGQPVGQPLPHGGEVTAVAFRPDGAVFVTVCADEARLWRTADGQPVGPPLRHARPAQPDPRVYPKLTASFSPDGSLVATGGEDGTARLWDGHTGLSRGEPLRASGPVQSLAFSPDGRTLLTGSFDGSAQMWDVAVGRPRGPVLRHRGRVKVVAFSPDGQIAASGGVVEDGPQQPGTRRVLKGEVRLWDAATGRPLGEALEHTGPVWSLAFSPGGRLLLTGSEDQHARFYLVASGTPVGKALLHDGTVGAVAFSRDGTLALTASAGGAEVQRARVWELPPESGLGRPLVQPEPALEVAFCPDGRSLLTVAGDQVVRDWDLTSGRATELEPRLERDIAALVFSPDGRTFLTASQEKYAGGIVRLWDGAPRRVRHVVKLNASVAHAAFSADGSNIVVCTAGTLHWLDATTGKVLRDVPCKNSGPIGSVAPVADGRDVLMGDDRGALLWKSGRPDPRRVWTSPAGMTWVTLYPDQTKALLVAGGFAQVWDVHPERILGPPPFQAEGGFGRVAFSPDGRSVLIGSRDKVARLWDVATGHPLGPPPGHDRHGRVAVCPDGQQLVFGGLDGRITLWNVPAPLEGRAERVRLWVEALTGLKLDEQGAFH
jgi:WD40 repeat protein/serine/threonine protein kinase